MIICSWLLLIAHRIMLMSYQYLLLLIQLLLFETFEQSKCFLSFSSFVFVFGQMYKQIDIVRHIFPAWSVDLNDWNASFARVCEWRISIADIRSPLFLIRRRIELICIWWGKERENKGDKDVPLCIRMKLRRNDLFRLDHLSNTLIESSLTSLSQVFAVKRLINSLQLIFI